MIKATQPPKKGRHFYVIQDREDGPVDVYLTPAQGAILVVRGVELPEGKGENPAQQRLNAVGRLAEDVRARYYAWCESAEAIEI